MNTNTNNSSIFTRAHEATRKIRKVYTEADYRVTFACALRIEYAAINNPLSAQEEFSMLWNDGEALRFRTLNMIRYTMRKFGAAAPSAERNAETNAPADYDGLPFQNHFAFIRNADDIECVCNESIIRLAGFMDSHKYDNKPFQVILYNAVCSAAQFIDRHEKRHARALRYDAQISENGAETMREYIQDAPRTMELTASNPEEYALFIDALESVCADNEDKRILLLWACGYQEREIAERIGASRSKVWKRKQAIQKRRDAQRSAAAEA